IQDCNKKQKMITPLSLQVIEELLNDTDNLQAGPITSSLQKEVVALVDESTTIQMLNQYIFTINYVSKDLEGTKALDRLTKKIAVLLQNSKNYASNMQ
ncbi:23976_t:CDS:2, partial [Gigaspora rosea]